MFTGKELVRIIETLPDDQKDLPLLFVSEEDPDTSYGIDKVHVASQGFIVLTSEH